VQVIPDLCWCSITEPVFPPSARTLMTNSGKYAHYAPGLSARAVRFGSIAACAEAAVTGRAEAAPPAWLR
jgi:predicted aconitase